MSRKQAGSKQRAISEDKVTKAHILDQEYLEYLSSSRDRLYASQGQPQVPILKLANSNNRESRAVAARKNPRQGSLQRSGLPRGTAPTGNNVQVLRRQMSQDAGLCSAEDEQEPAGDCSQLLLWGCNASGQLGVGDELVGVHFDRVALVTYPAQIVPV